MISGPTVSLVFERGSFTMGLRCFDYRKQTNKQKNKKAFESCSVHWTWAEGDVEEEMEKAKQRRWRGM